MCDRKVCDDQEGNLCPACEKDRKAAAHESLEPVDPWRFSFNGVRRSINSLTGVMPEGFEYV